jgi:hypothetical protein
MRDDFGPWLAAETADSRCSSSCPPCCRTLSASGCGPRLEFGPSGLRWVPFAVVAGLGAAVPATAALAPPSPSVRFDSPARAPRDVGGFAAIPASAIGAFGDWDFQTGSPYSGHAAGIAALAVILTARGPSATSRSFDSIYEVTTLVGGPFMELTIPVTELPISAVSEPSAVFLCRPSCWPCCCIGAGGSDRMHRPLSLRRRGLGPSG